MKTIAGTIFSILILSLILPMQVTADPEPILQAKIGGYWNQKIVYIPNLNIVISNVGELSVYDVRCESIVTGGLLDKKIFISTGIPEIEPEKTRYAGCWDIYCPSFGEVNITTKVYLRYKPDFEPIVITAQGIVFWKFIVIKNQHSTQILKNALSHPETTNRNNKNSNYQKIQRTNTLDLDEAPDEIWNRTYELGFGYSVQETNDGGFIIGGTRENRYSDGKTDIWTMKTDQKGIRQWEQLFGGVWYDAGYSIIQASDEGYVITGFINLPRNSSKHNPHIFLGKVDRDGTILWEKDLGKGTGYAIDNTADDGFIVTGTYNKSLVMIKTDLNGDIVWNSTFYTPQSWIDRGFSIQQLQSGGFIITGSTWPNNALTEVLLLRIDSNGTVLWNRTYGGKKSDWGKSVIQTYDEGYVIVGTTQSYGAGRNDIWMLKTDAMGNEEWNYTFGGPLIDNGACVQQTTDGGFIITGTKDQNYPDSSTMWLIKTDEHGSMLWEKELRRYDRNDGSGVIQTVNRDYIVIGGTAEGYCHSPDYLRLIKVAPEGFTNHPPETPVIDGQTDGSPNRTYYYTFLAGDPDSNDLYYYIDWGDNTSEDWIGPYYSDELLKLRHRWEERGFYTIRAKVKDTFGNESNWGFYKVRMSKSCTPILRESFAYAKSRFNFLKSITAPNYIRGYVGKMNQF